MNRHLTTRDLPEREPEPAREPGKMLRSADLPATPAVPPKPARLILAGKAPRKDAPGESAPQAGVLPEKYQLEPSG